MSAWTPTPSDPNDAPSGDSAPARHEHHLQMLDRLAEAGMNIVLAIEHQATSPDADSPNIFPGDLATAYARAARAVRMTIALSARLVEERERPTRLAKAGRKVRDGWPEPPPGEYNTIEEYIFELDRREKGERLEDSFSREDVRRPAWQVLAEIGRDLDRASGAAGLAADDGALHPHSSPSGLTRGPIDSSPSVFAQASAAADGSDPSACMGPRITRSAAPANSEDDDDEVAEGDGENWDDEYDWPDGS